MAVLAKTDASGGSGLLPEVLAFSSSLSLDKQLLVEDIVGSLAHVAMLQKQGIVPADAGDAIRRGLVSIYQRGLNGTLQLPDEEDVHMAVETLLHQEIGAPAGLLHSARSRNDQVATDLRLHVREQCAVVMGELATLVDELVARARSADGALVMPSYTHRQRAQPVTLAYWLSAYANAFLRDGHAFAAALQQADISPLGVGAISGTSLATDRTVTTSLLGFSRPSSNGLDTVGDRDFALDYLYAASKWLIHASRLSTDLIDFTTAEFGFAKLAGDIACGSSMMPQKKNPDVFELIRGKSGAGIGHLMAMLVTVKGLPGGYNRDLQEDREPLLKTGPLVRSTISVMRLALPRVSFDGEQMKRGVADGSTQATDLAEALVKKGLPFRVAYQQAGTLVRLAQQKGLALAQVSVELARTVHEAFDAQVLSVLEPTAAAARKESIGGTGLNSVAAQLEWLSAEAKALRERAAKVPRLAALFTTLSHGS